MLTSQRRFIEAVLQTYASSEHEKVDTDGTRVLVLSRKNILEVCGKHSIPLPMWLLSDPSARVGRGKYRVNIAGLSRQTSAQVQANAPHNVVSDTAPTTAAMAAKVVPISPSVHIEQDCLVPSRISGYVPFGNYSDVRLIVASNRFYPIYITGLSGNGKTMMVEQVCAIQKRECVRVNVTIETDEDDLLGGFRLVDGHTVWQNGPVVSAMERGAILLLDEVDLGSNKLMCLQPVLEGKPIYLKKINKLIVPSKGFNIVATANTKGKGSDDGRFIGTNVLNEAFLERFSVTMEQEYPSKKTEIKILNNVLKSSGAENTKFVQRIVSWADVIRKSFMDGAVSEIISTRRLVHICEAFIIFQHEAKAIELCVNRFDNETKKSFMELYSKLDDTAVPASPAPSADEEIAF